MANDIVHHPPLVEQTPPEMHDRAFRAFTIYTKEDDAAAAFMRRYGQYPEFILESLGNLLAGPIPA